MSKPPMMDMSEERKRKVIEDYNFHKKRSKEILSNIKARPPIDFRTEGFSDFVLDLFTDSSKLRDDEEFEKAFEVEAIFTPEEREAFNAEWEKSRKKFLKQAWQEFSDRHKKSKYLDKRHDYRGA